MNILYPKKKEYASEKNDEVAGQSRTTPTLAWRRKTKRRVAIYEQIADSTFYHCLQARLQSKQVYTSHLTVLHSSIPWGKKEETVLFYSTRFVSRSRLAHHVYSPGLAATRWGVGATARRRHRTGGRGETAT